MKNIDKIKEKLKEKIVDMTTEELASLLMGKCDFGELSEVDSCNEFCRKHIFNWLEQEEKVELLTKYDKKLLTRVALEIKNVRYITFSKENETYNRAVFITKNGFSFGYNFLNLYFKNLEFDKKYTLAELGLEVEE